MNELKEITTCNDFNGIPIKKGDPVIVDEVVPISGVITTVWNDGCVDIHHSDSHQGPVIDTYNVMDREVQKMDDN